MLEDTHPAFVPFCRYLGGGIVTILTAYTGICLAVQLPNADTSLTFFGPQTLFTTMAVFGIGFFSVFFGTLVAPKSSPHICSWAYTAIGILCYVFVWSKGEYPTIRRANMAAPPLPLLFWSLLGGIACALIFTAAIRLTRRAEVRPELAETR